MSAKDQTSDTLPPQFVRWSPAFLKLINSTKSSIPAEDFPNELRSFCTGNCCGLLRRFAGLVKLRTPLRPAISAAAKRRRQHGGPHDGRERRIRLDRVAAGIHDFWRTPTVRRSPTTGSSGGRLSTHGL